MDSSNNSKILASMQGIVKSLEDFRAALEKAYTWYQDNEEIISKYLLAFADFGVWSVAMERLIENQIIFTDALPQDLAQEIYDGADIDKTVCSYYFGNNEYNMERVISRCQQNKHVQKYAESYDQIISAYRINHYWIACIGLFSLTDGVLADVSGQTTTKFESRLDIVRRKMVSKKELSDIDRKTFYIYKALGSFETSIFSNSNFSEQEPKVINRHWDLHGRTHRKHSKIDFLKVLLYLDAIIFS